MKIAIAGLSKYVESIEKILQPGVEIIYYLDNDSSKRNQIIRGRKIYLPYNCPLKAVEYVLITNIKYHSLQQELLLCGFSSEQLIPFFSEEFNLVKFQKFFDLEEAYKIRLNGNLELLNRKVKMIESEYEAFKNCFIYEVADKLRKSEILLPNIKSIDETCNEIIYNKSSMSRFGDGEFEIIFGNAKDIYQKNNKKLAVRLREILLSNIDNHIVALADDYGCMEGLREENKNIIRRYMTESKRKMHYACIDMNKQYYNAYISRPYVIYPHNDRAASDRRFKKLKEIWDKQKLLIVEGEKTRMGVGNDLFHNSVKIERIIAPNENAYDTYDKIYDASLKLGKGKLILIALGPTATVLAYDLAKAGYWALDIGHLDLEYEWFLRGEGYSYIPEKYNNELPGDEEVIPIMDEAYEQSIIERIFI